MRFLWVAGEDEGPGTGRYSQGNTRSLEESKTWDRLQHQGTARSYSHHLKPLPVLSLHEISSVLLKLEVPTRTMKRVVWHLCGLGSIINSCIIPRQPGAVVHDGREEERLGPSLGYCFLFAIILTSSILPLCPVCNPEPKISMPMTYGRRFIFQNSVLVGANKTSRINSLSCTLRLHSLVWIPAWLLTGVPEPAEPLKSLICGLQHRLCYKHLCRSEKHMYFIIEWRHLPYRVNKEL